MAFDVKHEAACYASAMDSVAAYLIRELGLNPDWDDVRAITFRAINTYKRTKDGVIEPTNDGADLLASWRRRGVDGA